MIRYYAWNILLAFIIAFGLVAGFYLVGKYGELERTCLKLQRQNQDLRDELRRKFQK